MIIDGTPFGEYTRTRAGSRPIDAFMAFIEKKTGATVVFDRRRFPHGRADLSEAHRIASLLHEEKIIDSFSRPAPLHDEPPIKSWMCRLASKVADEDTFTGG